MFKPALMPMGYEEKARAASETAMQVRSSDNSAEVATTVAEKAAPVADKGFEVQQSVIPDWAIGNMGDIFESLETLCGLIN